MHYRVSLSPFLFFCRSRQNRQASPRTAELICAKTPGRSTMFVVSENVARAKPLTKLRRDSEMQADGRKWGRLYRNSRTCVSCSVAASVASLARPSSYLSRAVSRSSKFCSSAETSCLAAASTAATFCVMDLTWPITLSSRKSYGNVSVHSASSCTSRGTKRCNRSWNTYWIRSLFLYISQLIDYKSESIRSQVTPSKYFIYSIYTVIKNDRGNGISSCGFSL